MIAFETFCFTFIQIGPNLIYDFHCAEEKESEVKLDRVGLSTIFLFSMQAKHSSPSPQAKPLPGQASFMVFIAAEKSEIFTRPCEARVVLQTMLLLSDNILNFCYPPGFVFRSWDDLVNLMALILFDRNDILLFNCVLFR